METILVSDAARQHSIESGQVGHWSGPVVIDARFVGPVTVSIAAARIRSKIRIPAAREIPGEWIEGGIICALWPTMRLYHDRQLGEVSTLRDC